MFRLFQMFKSLLERPAIREAAENFYILFLREVGQDIELLKNKYINNQNKDLNQANVIKKIQGFPSVSN